jgi:hypothetical protein
MPDYKPMTAAEKKALKEKFAKSKISEKLKRIEKMDPTPKKSLKAKKRTIKPAKRVATKDTEGGGRGARMLRKMRKLDKDQY